MLDYPLSIAVITLIWTLLAQSFNLSFGLAGLFNLGHIIFYGIGAYSAAIFNTRVGIGFLPNLAISAILAAIFATGFGVISLRLRGHYLAIATLGGAMIASVVATNWTNLTRGPLGIRGIENPEIFNTKFDTELSIFILYFAITALALLALHRIFHSPFGRILRAIRDDELSATASGKNIFVAKIWSFILSATFAGIAGAMYSHYRLFLDPTIFALPEIITAVLIVVVGGRGNFWGCLGATFLVVAILYEIHKFLDFPDQITGALRNFLFASLLISTMLWRPAGIFTKK